MGKMSEPQEIPTPAKETSWIKKLAPWVLVILWVGVVVMLSQGVDFETIATSMLIVTLLTGIWDVFWYFKK